tara:strand:+ start:5710 stop:5922 length:213 start_codon:yes stop_codon:yes gene_type:complete
MKIKVELELDTNDDVDIGSELLDLVTLLKTRLENFNPDAMYQDEDDDYEEEIVAENPKPGKRSYRGRRRN